MNEHIEVLRGLLNYPGLREYVGRIIYDKAVDALEAAEDECRAITAVEVTLFGRACYLPADIAQEVEQACAAYAHGPKPWMG